MMNFKTLFAVAGLSLALSSAANAAVYSFQGSDTLAAVMSDAIIASGMNGEIGYTGGGSGKGEAAMVAGEQGIAPMSREVTADAIEKGRAAGVSFVARVIALDGLGIFVNRANALAGL